MFLFLKGDLHLTDCFYSLNVNSTTENNKKKKINKVVFLPIRLQETVIQGCFLSAKGRPLNFHRFWISVVTRFCRRQNGSDEKRGITAFLRCDCII